MDNCSFPAGCDRLRDGVDCFLLLLFISFQKANTHEITTAMMLKLASIRSKPVSFQCASPVNPVHSCAVNRYSPLKDRDQNKFLRYESCCLPLLHCSTFLKDRDGILVMINVFNYKTL